MPVTRPVALFNEEAAEWPHFAPHLRAAFAAAGLDVELRERFDGRPVDYLIHGPNGPEQNFARLPGLKAVLNLWAGVERVVTNPTLTVPLTRMVDPGMTEGMAEYVAAHVLRFHVGTDRHVLGQDGLWRPETPPLARDRPVGVLGLGVLGAATARMLAVLGFPVTGWSRRPATVPGVTCLGGAEGLRAVLSQAQIVVLLVPLTPDTANLLNAERLGWLPRGAAIVNPGRGGLIDDDALLAALDSGQVGHATLDVFRTEPLPPDHPFWAHPRVTVTPHIASVTRPESASRVIAENIRRAEAGEPLLHLVDRGAGY